MRRLLLALTLLAAPLVAIGPAGAAGDTRALPDGHGIHVVSVRRPGPRLVRVVVSTAALSRPVRVNVLLPRSYDASRRHYPTVYLFHGTSGGADDWLRNGEVRRTTAGEPVITVMPDAGYDSNGGSWFTDWVDQDTALGAARWETFHVDQLVPWVDDTFRTVPHRRARAIAGLSQGGFGAYTYASRHPDLFVAAGSFSGAPDIARNPVAKQGASAVIAGTMTGLNGVEPNAPFGDPVTDDINWHGHNPADLVTNLRHQDLQLWCGNGQPGPLDDPGPGSGGSSAIEAFVHQSTTYFADYATAAHVHHVFHDYGPGTHTWPYWARDLRHWLPHVEQVFAQHRHRPRAISYRSIDATWSQWGWHAVTHRDAAQAWSRLWHASTDGFTWRGGAATLRTPAAYDAGAAYAVSWPGHVGTVVADDAGRLVIDVPDVPGPLRVAIRPA